MADSLLPDYASDAIGAVQNAGQEAQNVQSTQATAPDATAQQGVNAVQTLVPLTANAQNALAAPAAYEQAQGTQQGQVVQGQGNSASSTALQQQQDAYAAYQASLNQTHQATLDAESQLQQTAAAAKIDPDRYLNNLGVGQRTIAAIGMALSGVGSGLSGQPNMAYDMLQKSIQRDIAGQQQNFMNQVQQYNNKMGIVHSAQENQILANTALSAATQSVLTGAQVALSGTQTAIGSNYAQANAAQLKMLLDQKLLDSTNAFSELYKRTATSGSSALVNGTGVLMNGASNAMRGRPMFMVNDPSMSPVSPSAVVSVGNGSQAVSATQSAPAQSSPSKASFLKRFLDANSDLNEP